LLPVQLHSSGNKPKRIFADSNKLERFFTFTSACPGPHPLSSHPTAYSMKATTQHTSRALRLAARCCHYFALGKFGPVLAIAPQRCMLPVDDSRSSPPPPPPAGMAGWREDASLRAADRPALMVRMAPLRAVAVTFLGPGPPPGQFSAPEPAHRCLLGVGRWIPPSPGCRGPDPPLAWSVLPPPKRPRHPRVKIFRRAETVAALFHGFCATAGGPGALRFARRRVWHTSESAPQPGKPCLGPR